MGRECIKVNLEKTIKNPFVVNHKIYLIMIIILCSGLAFCSYRIFDLKNRIYEIVQNISLGCLASVIVAWVLEFTNVRDKNKLHDKLYSSAYYELYFVIGNYLEVWANLCTATFKEEANKKERRIWYLWYKKTKYLFYSKKEYRNNKRLIQYFLNEIQHSSEYIMSTVEKLLFQKNVLRVNNIYDKEIGFILEDLRFEFDGVDKLGNDIDPDEFWKTMECINKDLYRIIKKWKDIRYYNYVYFPSHGFHEVCDYWVQESKQSGARNR